MILIKTKRDEPAKERDFAVIYINSKRFRLSNNEGKLKVIKMDEEGETDNIRIHAINTNTIELS